VLQLERDSAGVDELLIKAWKARTSEINKLTQKHHDEVAMLHTQVSRTK
jgi:hypothetical protein